MTEETAAPVEEPAAADVAEVEVEEEPRIPRERLNQETKKRKEAEKKLTDMQRRLDELEAAGLSETEQERKARERVERERDELKAERDQLAQDGQKARAESWITAAARDAGFEDAEDAVLRINAADIETAEDAERAVKRLAKAKPRLLAAEEPKLPGQVLANGRATTGKDDGKPKSAIDPEGEARGIADALKPFLNSWREVG